MNYAECSLSTRLCMQVHPLKRGFILGWLWSLNVASGSAAYETYNCLLSWLAIS